MHISELKRSWPLPLCPRSHNIQFTMSVSLVLPAQNSTTTHDNTWHTDPVFRGTWGIVSNCLSALIICVWSAVHVDITRSGRLLTKPGAREFAAYILSCRWQSRERKTRRLESSFCYPEAYFLRITPSDGNVADDSLIIDEGQQTAVAHPGQPVQIEDYTFTILAKEADSRSESRSVFGMHY